MDNEKDMLRNLSIVNVAVDFFQLLFVFQSSKTKYHGFYVFVVKVWRMRSLNFCIILVFHQSNSPDSAGLGCGVQTGKPLKLATEERSCGSR